MSTATNHSDDGNRTPASDLLGSASSLMLWLMVVSASWITTAEAVRLVA